MSSKLLVKFHLYKSANPINPEVTEFIKKEHSQIFLYIKRTRMFKKISSLRYPPAIIVYNSLYSDVISQSLSFPSFSVSLFFLSNSMYNHFSLSITFFVSFSISSFLGF